MEIPGIIPLSILLLCRTDCLLSVKAKFATDSRDELHFYFYRIVILVQYVSSRSTDLI